MRAVERGLEPEDLARLGVAARPARVGGRRAGPRRVRRGDGLLARRAPTTRPGSSARRPTCSRRTTTRSTGCAARLDADRRRRRPGADLGGGPAAARWSAPRTSTSCSSATPTAAVQTFRGADPRCSPTAWTALGDGPDAGCCPRRTASRRPAARGQPPGRPAGSARPVRARSPRAGRPPAGGPGRRARCCARRPRRRRWSRPSCARPTCSTGCRGRRWRWSCAARGAPATLRRVLMSSGVPVAVPSQRGPGPRRDGGPARCCRCSTSCCGRRSGDADADRPRDGGRRRALPDRRCRHGRACAGCGGRCAARSSTAAAAAPATSCWPRRSPQPDFLRRAWAPRRAPARRVAAGDRGRCRGRAHGPRRGRTRWRWAPGVTRRDGAVGDVVRRPGWARRGARSRWRAAWPALAPTATSTPSWRCSTPPRSYVDRLPQAGPRGVPRPTSAARTSPATRSSRGRRSASRSPCSTPQAAAGRAVAARRGGRGAGGRLARPAAARVAAGLRAARRRRHRARPSTFRAAQAAVRYDETRLFLVAVTRASERLLVTAVRSDDEQPSVYLDVVDPPETIDGPTS